MEKLKLSGNYTTIKRQLNFQIAYKTGEKVIIERVNAACHADAIEIANSRGEFINCVYCETNGDLLYLH